MADITHALQSLCLGAEWYLNGEEYENLVWLDGHGFDKPTLEEINSKIQELNVQEPWNYLRRERNQLLKQTDWSQGSDVPDEIKSAYQGYRQTLRDLPANTSDPSNPTWPNPPA
jgi:hypothetical protein|tara:strand:- start:202 stop:543 length:342 start_codon:yes stop_codon:yes gene_type:complete